MPTQTYEELIAERDAIQRKVDEAFAHERELAFAKIRELMQQYSIRVVDPRESCCECRLPFRFASGRFRCCCALYLCIHFAVAVGLDPVSRGQCGEMAREDLARLRELLQIDQVINRLSALEEETDAVWVGYKTDLAVAKTYVVFQGALAAAVTSSYWQDEGFGVIERGSAGAVAAAAVSNSYLSSNP